VDDGAVVYINGVEVARLRLPAAPASITPSTRATNAPSDGSAPVIYRVPATAVHVGGEGSDLVVAAEVHQVNGGSSDVSFDLELIPDGCGCDGNLAGTHAVVRPPFLQILTSRSVIIKWETETGVVGAVRYGTSADALGVRVNDQSCRCVEPCEVKH